MKKILTFISIALSAAAFTLAASAEDYELNYAVKEDGTAVITGSDYVQGGELVIPAEIDGYTVSEIGEYAFVNQAGISTVTLPDTVKIIGGSAFNGCKRLESINFSEGLAEIQKYSFSNCSSLKEITIPDSVTDIGIEAFSDCYYIHKVTIGDGLKEISESTFRGCSYLTDVTLGENVREIGSNAFSNTALKTIYIPASVTNIRSYAFYSTGYFDVNYSGAETQWRKIDIAYGNSELENAEIKYMRNAKGKIDNTVLRKNIFVVLTYIVIAAVILVPGIVLAARKNNTCKSCGAPREEDALFCGKCGTKY